MALPVVPLAIAGAALSAASAISTGITQKNEATYQAQVAQNNATIARQNAQAAQQAGSAQAQAQGLAAAEQLGGVKAAEAANNVDVNTGSAAVTQESQRETGALSQQTIENNALLQAYGYQSQATGFQAEAGLENYAASTAVPGAVLSAGGSLLSGASLLPLKFAAMGLGTTPGAGGLSGLPDTAAGVDENL